jgi:hypothetical protein
MTGFVTPDEAQYIYVGSSPGGKDFFLWSRSLPFKNETADLLTRIPKPVNNDSETFTPILPGAFDTSATVSSNGKRALILGYLLTLE